MRGKVDREQIRIKNRALILRALRREGPLARIELCARTGLSPATVTAITSDLIDEGVIAPQTGDEAPGPEPAHRGRPRTNIGLVASLAQVLAVRITAGQLTFTLAGFDGAVIREETVTVATIRETREGFPATLAAEAARFLAASNTSMEAVSEIAIAAQGVVDLAAGALLWSPAFAARNIEIAGPLSHRTKCPVTVSNDANMVAEGLYSADPDRFGSTFAVLLLDDGIGMGFMIDGVIYRGAHGAAMEFGHMNHDIDGPLCRCGRRGCVEAYAGGYALYREAARLPPDTDPWDMIVNPAILQDLADRADAGAADALAVFERAGRVLGTSVGRMAALTDPGRVIVTGRNVAYVPLIKPGFNSALAESLVQDLRDPLEFVALTWDSDVVARGLIASALARVGDRFAGVRPAPDQSGLSKGAAE